VIKVRPKQSIPVPSDTHANKNKVRLNASSEAVNAKIVSPKIKPSKVEAINFRCAGLRIFAACMSSIGVISALTFG